MTERSGGGLLGWRTMTNTVKYRFHDQKSQPSNGASVEILDTISTLETILSKLSPTSNVTKRLLTKHIAVYGLLVQLEDFLLMVSKRNRLQRLFSNARVTKRLEEINSAFHKVVIALQDDISRLLDKTSLVTGGSSLNGETKKSKFIERLKASSYLAQHNDPDACKLWEQHVGLENKMTEWKNFLRIVGGKLEQETEKDLKYILDYSGTGYVSQYKFSELLRGFGPFPKILSNVKSILSSPYFFGYLSSHESSQLLYSTRRHAPGSFLLRFSQSYPGAFAVCILPRHSSSIADHDQYKTNFNNPNNNQALHILLDRGDNNRFVIPTNGTAAPPSFDSLEGVVNWLKGKGTITDTIKGLSREDDVTCDFTLDEAHSLLKSESSGSFLILALETEWNVENPTDGKLECLWVDESKHVKRSSLVLDATNNWYWLDHKGKKNGSRDAMDDELEWNLSSEASDDKEKEKEPIEKGTIQELIERRKAFLKRNVKLTNTNQRIYADLSPKGERSPGASRGRSSSAKTTSNSNNITNNSKSESTSPSCSPTIARELFQRETLYGVFDESFHVAERKSKNETSKVSPGINEESSGKGGSEGVLGRELSVDELALISNGSFVIDEDHDEDEDEEGPHSNNGSAEDIFGGHFAKKDAIPFSRLRKTSKETDVIRDEEFKGDEKIVVPEEKGRNLLEMWQEYEDSGSGNSCAEGVKGEEEGEKEVEKKKRKKKEKGNLTKEDKEKSARKKKGKKKKEKGDKKRSEEMDPSEAAAMVRSPTRAKSVVEESQPKFVVAEETRRGSHGDEKRLGSSPKKGKDRGFDESKSVLRGIKKSRTKG